MSLLCKDIFFSIVQERLNGLVISERIETVIPLTYILCFLMAWYGPNAEFLGSIKLTIWHHHAVINLVDFLQNLCLCLFVDLMSLVCNAIILWTTVRISIIKILKKIQDEFWLVFAVQEAALIVEVVYCQYICIIWPLCLYTYVLLFQIL